MSQARRKKVGRSAAANRAVVELRAQIDALDSQLVRLINRRATVARQIGRLKAREGVKPYAPSREIQIYGRVAALNKGPISDEALRAIYREVMSATIALEQPTRVCYFGQPGSFTHLAARVKFGSSVRYLPGGDIRDVFAAVAHGSADYGVVPIENSTEGGVNQTADLLADTRLKVVSEIYLPVHHHLLARGPLKSVRVVYSHPQGFAQCRQWLNAQLRWAQRREAGSTAEAAQLAARRRQAGAIAGLLAAEIYRLPIRARNVEDQADNITRFFVIGEQICEPTGQDKTSLVVSIKDQRGALMRLLRPFHAHGINLTRIESRPSRRRAWDYLFFIDMEGHVADRSVRAALREVNSQVRHVEVLGSYPAAPPVPGADLHAVLQDRASLP
jgi:chorismate mutase/prephenate dehydratase